MGIQLMGLGRASYGKDICLTISKDLAAGKIRNIKRVYGTERGEDYV